MASITVSQVIHAGGPAVGYSKTTRRQYQSCDQCRKSRRACDASTLRVANFPLPDDETVSLATPICEACSNCAKTNKKCTFEWLRSLPLQGLPKGVKRKLELTGLSDPADLHPVPLSDAVSQSSRSDNPDFAYSPTSKSRSPERVDGGAASAPVVPQHSFHFQPSCQQGRNDGSLESSLSHITRDQTGTAPVSRRADGDQVFRQSFNETENLDDDPMLHGFTRVKSYSSSVSPSSAESRTVSARSHVLTGNTPTSSDIHPENAIDDHPPRHPHSTVYTSASKPAPASHDRVFSADGPSPRLSFSSGKSNDTRCNLISLNTSQVGFADSSLKTMVATGLLRIYHDSFENSLSCWVTEKNCPYECEIANRKPPESMCDETAFRLRDNRIFSRVSRLDSAFAKLRGRELSQSENRAATKALNAAIMAFASQWSHSSHNAFWRSKGSLPQLRTGQDNTKTASQRGEYESVIQKTLWHEARRAIHACVGTDSFKVILAYVLFSLTQKPFDESGLRASSESNKSGSAERDPVLERRRGRGSTSELHATSNNTTPVSHEIAGEEWDPFNTTELEELASPPAYLEVAVRHLFTWRRKVERDRRKRSKTIECSVIPALALKDEQTFNILFWLGVMCDTTSSAITKRPLIIADEDCAVICDEQASLGQQDDDAGALWGDYLMSSRWAGPQKSQPRWPCSFEEAAVVLQEAIPIKVLMFRKVGQLQTLAYRRTAPRKLEQCVGEALAVYQHWNDTYGQFMLDCVNAHNSIPPPVQSWYVILDGHWHYGCLLLADTIAQLDREERTMEAPRHLRDTCRLIAELRRDNAQAIARIARASLSEYGPSYPDNSEFHFACNGSAILTEPWTDILVRSMGTACRVFINCLSSWDDSTDSMHDWVVSSTLYDDLYAQAVTCIQAMSLLGRKSNAANYMADVLWDRLRHVCPGR
ncbi:hypothetical protein LTR10_023855 [Elasticomyces elasticus]|uniref:Zn(2)-C6 fungal-type domain-containing protein n=1 Tax=Exophiala sideris TaxID=1016849 RepID=A0ABR0IXB7_9EURO|nr:hypothetical protein LTR10_023855 [Elasticomyces elasticus]KAK5022131.1 hypothetical protein LTS07_010381 [Exophiala sideris]KAK5025064.1 hypothetical protein LTR13_010624 [Exophiala sideris]KAK5051158.1 hypothetical protein LTR69_010370 [Exophiala sideris]KAK5176823.1 hypothetical protein LTR44_010644 [Eurotiomycetes sp. CCFEE 6388]